MEGTQRITDDLDRLCRVAASSNKSLQFVPALRASTGRPFLRFATQRPPLNIGVSGKGIGPLGRLCASGLGAVPGCQTRIIG